MRPGSLRILVADIFLHHFLAHISKRTHIVTVAPEMPSPEGTVPYLRMVLEKDFCAVPLQVFHDT